MSVVTRRIPLFASMLVSVGLFALAACGTLEPERQWYKPGDNYTVAEFKQDRAACTKNKVLDEQCLKQHGWVPLSGDREPPARQQQSPKSGGSRY
jgi:hypothetical protein